MIYTASWLLPMNGPPIQKGQILVRDGLIEVIGTDLRKEYPYEPLKDMGDAILMPGFVNAHSHIDFSLLKGSKDGKPFKEWLASMTAFLLGCSPDDFYWSGMLGAAEMIRAGITCIGDSTPFGNSARVISDIGLRGVVYRETFDHSHRLHELADHLADLQEKVSDTVRIGVSPHAIHTSGPEIVRLSERMAAEHDLPFMIHLAETRNEARSCESYRSPTAYLAELDVLSPNCLVAHCVHCDDEDLAIIAQTGAAVAHCPRSNCLLGSGIAPLLRMMDAGLRIGLGTDSSASNFNLSLLDEARFALALHRGRKEEPCVISPETILRMATRGGAEALGLEKVGCLAPGWAADFIAVRVDDESALMCYNPYNKLVFGDRAEVVLSVVAGREILSDGKLQTVDESTLRENVRRSAAGLGGRKE